MPRPPSSSPDTAARITLPRKGIPASLTARTACHIAATPAFMSQAPRATMRSLPSIVISRGVNGSALQASMSPGGTTSVWPFSISVGPVPSPARVAVRPIAELRATSMPGNCGSCWRPSTSMSQRSTS